MKHTANHWLPISNGYGGTGNDLQVYCGHCKGYYEPDARWAQRYLEARERELLRAVHTPGPYGITEEQRAEILAEYRNDFGHLLEESA